MQLELDWITNPITLCALTGTGLVGSLSMWLSARLELRSVRKTLNSSLESMEAGIRAVSASLEEVRSARNTPHVPPPAPVVPSAQMIQGLNLTKRSQALRMQRRGESLASIASALQIPQSEVALLLKLDRLMEFTPASGSKSVTAGS